MYKYSLIVMVLLVTTYNTTAQENYHNYARYSHDIVSADVHQSWEHNETSHQKHVNELVAHHYGTPSYINKNKEIQPIFDFQQDNSDLDQEGESTEHKEESKSKTDNSLNNEEIKKQIEEEVDRIISLRHLEERISQQEYKTAEQKSNEQNNHIDSFNSNYYPTNHIEIEQESIYNDDYYDTVDRKQQLSSEQIYNSHLHGEIDSHPTKRFFYP